MVPAGDAQLLRIVDAALLDAAQRAGHWLACRPGCNQCCTGVFRISQLDAARLRQGLQHLRVDDPHAAAQVEHRIRRTVASLAPTFPGDTSSGVLFEDDASLKAFEDFGDDAVCPVLNPATGTCTLYSARPMTCRTFGPPVRTDDGGLGTCELCFQGATEQQVQHAQLVLPPSALEDELESRMPVHGSTIIAFAFVQSA